MNDYMPKFIPVNKPAPSPHNSAGGFVPISFARKRLDELCEGYYCIELEDGRTEFVEAHSAMEALRMAQTMGNVVRVHRESLQRRRMVKKLVNPDAVETEEHAIKPGTVMLSFEELCRWQDKKDGIVAASTDATPAAEEPTADPTLAEALSGDGPSSAGEVAAALLAQVRQGAGDPA